MSPIPPPIAGDPAGCRGLRGALAALAVCSQAVGTLMAEHGVSADAARAWLAHHARQAGLPVDLVAAQLTAPYAGPVDEDRRGPSSR